MGKLGCVCGNTIYMEGEGDSEFTLIPDKSITKVADLLGANELTTENFLDIVRWDDGRDVLICDKCKRIFLEDKTEGSYGFIIYKLMMEAKQTTYIT